MPIGIYERKIGINCGFNKGRHLWANKSHPKGMLGKSAWNKGLTKKTDNRIKKYADKRKGIIFSEKHRKNMSKNHADFRKIKHPRWKGRKTPQGNGYMLIHCFDKPFPHQNRLLEHRFIIEQYLKRYLKSNEIVHHINGNKADNRLKNLMVFSSIKYHNIFHKRGYCNPKGVIFNGQSCGHNDKQAFSRRAGRFH